MDTNLNPVLDLQLEELESMEALWNWAEFAAGLGAGVTAVSIGVAVAT